MDTKRNNFVTYQRPKFVENLFGRNLSLNKYNSNRNVSDMFYYPHLDKNDDYFSEKKSRWNNQSIGQLPLRTAPKLYRNVADRQLTEFASSNEKLKKSDLESMEYKPWTIFDYALIQPTSGDVRLDPRYATHAEKFFTDPYLFGDI